MKLLEANIDGLVGPTHNYAGLAFGNVASEKYAGKVSNPRAAALQGLAKMRMLMLWGVPQMVMPPHPRPEPSLLQHLGFTNIAQVTRDAPELLSYLYSSSGMWAANAATVCPSIDAADATVHFTPANLVSTAHRAIEAPFASHVLQALFPDVRYFTHHAPLPANPLFSDEGAANHMRLENPQGEGVHVFVYGKSLADAHTHGRYPARQSFAASQAVARLHRLTPSQTLFIRQQPSSIDTGVFHNDVIATSHKHVLFYHERAYVEGDAPAKALEKLGIHAIRVSEKQLPLQEAVRTYLFNSQIIDTPGGDWILIAPAECHASRAASAVLEDICASNSNPISRVEYVDLRESMQNGGGPACLRLRVPLTQEEWRAAHHGAVLTDALYDKLKVWINKHYREQLHPGDLRDSALAEEAYAALDELTHLLHLGNIYAFQY